MSTVFLPVDQSSPVSWQIIVWILLPLAASSMVQSSIRRGVHPMTYLAVSPFASAAEALSLLLSVLYARSALDISIGGAIRFVSYWSRRGEPGRHVTTIDKSLDQTVWLRWILFLVSTVPALVKLATFSGIPMTKTWGFMYGISYLVIELVTSVPRLSGKGVPSSAAEALAYSPSTWDDDAATNDLSKMDEGLSSTLTTLSVTVQTLAALIELSLVGWMFYSLQPYEYFRDLRDRTPIAIIDSIAWARMATISTILATWLLVAILGAILMIKKKQLPRSSSGSRFVVNVSSLFSYLLKRLTNLKVSTAISLISAFDPHSTAPPPGNLSRKILTYLIGIVIFCTTYLVLQLLCAVAPPRLARRLLRPESDKHQVHVHDEKKIEGAVLIETETETETDKSCNFSEVDLVVLAYFCLLVPLVILWYAVRYDSQGTIDPGWMRVPGWNR